MRCIKYVCDEHLDEEIDHFLDEAGVMPVMEAVLESKTCDQCGRVAKYEVLGSDVEIEWA